jgi:tetratricopeptide (TPR) repeat protein
MTQPEDRIQNAVSKKQEGNNHVAAGEFKRAAFAYKMLYLLVGDLLPAEVQRDYNKHRDGGATNDGVASIAQKKQVAVHEDVQRAALGVFLSGVGNLALCHLKLGRYVECCHCASLVLDHEGDKQSSACTRAHFRRGSAKLALGDLDAAATDLQEVLRRVPDDPGAVAKMAELQALHQQAEAKNRMMCKRMFA